MEDSRQPGRDPAPTIAARIEQRMAAIGVELFNAIFQSNADARDLWANLRGELNDTRVEIVTGVREATALPWELLRDPKTDAALALEAQSFVRASSQPARRPRLPQSASGPAEVHREIDREVDSLLHRILLERRRTRGLGFGGCGDGVSRHYASGR